MTQAKILHKKTKFSLCSEGNPQIATSSRFTSCSNLDKIPDVTRFAFPSWVSGKGATSTFAFIFNAVLVNHFLLQLTSSSEQRVSDVFFAIENWNEKDKNVLICDLQRIVFTRWVGFTCCLNTTPRSRERNLQCKFVFAIGWSELEEAQRKRFLSHIMYNWNHSICWLGQRATSGKNVASFATYLRGVVWCAQNPWPVVVVLGSISVFEKYKNAVCVRGWWKMLFHASRLQNSETVCQCLFPSVAEFWFHAGVHTLTSADLDVHHLWRMLSLGLKTKTFCEAKNIGRYS